MLAQSKLDSIGDIILLAMQNGHISSNELHKVLQEVEKCRKFKADIGKNDLNNRKNYLNKEEKKAKKIFYKKSQILQVPMVSVPVKT